MSSTTTVRDPAFARRLEQAADLHPHCPPKHRGRLDWVRGEMEKKGQPVSNETIRKWFAGQIRPRQDKGDVLAEIMMTDPSWLQMGHKPVATQREVKVRNALAGGVVNVIAGLIQMDGGTPAFPDEDGPVDLHAIIRGAKYDFHVALGEAHGRQARFHVPANHRDTIVLGVIRDGMAFDVFELTGDLIESHGRRVPTGVEIEIDGAELPRIKDFASRL